MGSVFYFWCLVRRELPAKKTVIVRQDSAAKNRNVRPLLSATKPTFPVSVTKRKSATKAFVLPNLQTRHRLVVKTTSTVRAIGFVHRHRSVWSVSKTAIAPPDTATTTVAPRHLQRRRKTRSIPLLTLLQSLSPKPSLNPDAVPTPIAAAESSAKRAVVSNRPVIAAKMRIVATTAIVKTTNVSRDFAIVTRSLRFVRMASPVARDSVTLRAAKTRASVLLSKSAFRANALPKTKFPPVRLTANVPLPMAPVVLEAVSVA